MTPQNTRLHVLAVDDEPTILAVYAELLTEEGYRVTTERLPPADHAAVAALAPDLLVFDLLTGRLDWGTTFLTMLRTDQATQGLPVVVCTAATDVVKRLAPQLAEWGVAVVFKPFDIDDFLGAVRAKLDPGGVNRADREASRRAGQTGDEGEQRA